MFSPDQYELLDFGEGRRLERFGAVTLDRPCPAAEGIARAAPEIWRAADARFTRTDKEHGEWMCGRRLPQRWTIAHGRLALEMKRTVFGHVGVFPEQAENWDWIAQQVADRPRVAETMEPQARLRVLNLFAYTGASTLAAAAAGAEVVHLDAAKNIVAWARRNAEVSGLADAPIRWIAEDAMKFVQRELRRGNRYDGVILDPPSYGHGFHGEEWRVSKHLRYLLQLCGQLTAPRPRFMLLTCHTPGFTPVRLREMMGEAMNRAGPGTITAAPLTLRAASGLELPSGVSVRWEQPVEQ